MITSSMGSHVGAGNAEMTDNKKQSRRQSSEDIRQLQELGEKLDIFTRLERAFSSLGWSLFPLSGDSCLAVHRKWQMSQVCPDYRAASALLRRIGGAV
jgi:hypothetical protein